MPTQKYYYAIVNKANGNMAVLGGKLPIYYYKRVAVEECKTKCGPKFLVSRIPIAELSRLVMKYPTQKTD